MSHCKKSILPPPSSGVIYYPFADGGVLYLKGSRRIWALNSTSALIWRLSGKVATLEELAGRVASTFQIDKNRAQQDTGTLLDIFEGEGLFSSEQYTENMESDQRWDISPTGPILVEPVQWAIRQSFRIAGHFFEFCCQDVALGAAFTHIMDHLAADNGSLPDTRLAVTSGSAGAQTWDLFIDDLGYHEGLQPNEVLPHIATLVFVRCCEALKERLLFHAAVVEKDGTTIIFPGEAGSGKTTLVAALLSDGCRFFSDELAVINVDDHRVSPLPLPMSIKPGSVKPLERYYPGLSSFWVHQRSDGKTVRYLSPSSLNLPAAPDSSAPVDFLIFPKYSEDVQSRLVTIDKLEALQRLAATGSSNRAFGQRDFEVMIALVEGRPCYEMVFSDLNQAVMLLKRHVFGSL